METAASVQDQPGLSSSELPTAPPSVARFAQYCISIVCDVLQVEGEASGDLVTVQPRPDPEVCKTLFCSPAVWLFAG